ncbi:plasmid mobilization relaxosome protein MobC [Bosea sp. FBZP-16]|uniref:plasmid mobilization relaxosome protein MobC n=1 Tax=Bosea sp. FBZP-16 TaxID=2065382 RepID=UPI000831D063|nr:plasmid mobilization relaxosome protein MobC [Bosea sp. FBZP-16]
MEVAAAEGLTAGQLARRIVARDLGLEAKLNHVRRAIANAEVLRKVLGSLGAIGNNLNQIAARLNASGNHAEAVRGVDALREPLAEAFAVVIAALKRRRS